ncbi:MAG: hypothetical protein DCC43_04165 [Candidatus Brocadia sp.]|uniref:SprT-like domain-containing protein n=1 Tax=Candidatus Brocadia fulgida TaxID=380242 RepID=A0A0M2UW72_9BACT|nr:MAG: hypothetical protein BROFUL_02529 [Candidatus Brocadia fulgida]MCC6324650.1 hypothetical protein [Candidatus Brocadia sp.]MCE7910951.1 hypothetical protein [Candidatus Brocadia sp. AMX3]MBV6517764.1 hypothetical protein [Candidatus Brocadia fulgida]MDG5997289.1 hypothetical protein [Candidatus Brocadia sp.]
MNLEFDPSLIEEVIFGELKAREEKGDFTLTLEYHSSIDPVYENFPLDERPSQFKKIEWDFFKKLEYPKLIKEVFSEFPELEEKSAGGVIAKAVNNFDEGSYLTKGMNQESGQKRIVVKLLPERFLDIPYLKKLVRHELTHASDMLSDSYGYRDERLGGNPMEESIVKERYCVFWDIYVDSRLIRKGKETLSDKDIRYNEFSALYKKIPDEVKMAIFDVLWQDEKLTHEKILRMARDVNEVIKISDGLPIKHTLKKKKTILPGTQCPLCQFRTYQWMEGIEQDEYLVNEIKKDFPDWEPEDGVCGQCAEAYKVRKTVC